MLTERTRSPQGNVGLRGQMFRQSTSPVGRVGQSVRDGLAGKLGERKSSGSTIRPVRLMVEQSNS